LLRGDRRAADRLGPRPAPRLRRRPRPGRAHRGRDRRRRPRPRARRRDGVVATTPASEARLGAPPVRTRLLWTLGSGAFGLAYSFAYYLYEPPYRGLYPDVLPPSTYGRAQGVQHVLRGIALGIALVGGNFLLKVWAPAPFLTAACVTTGACGLTILLVREDGGHGRVFEGFWAYIKQSWNIFWQEGDVRRFLLANSAWEGTFAAARSFVILYVIDGLHESKTVSGEILAA